MKIAIVAFDQITDLDLILHWDLLQRVQHIAGLGDWQVRILGTSPSHTSVLGLPIPTSGPVEQVEEGNIATASSCLAGQYLSQWMIESLAGREVAAKVMETVLPLGMAAS